MMSGRGLDPVMAALHLRFMKFAIDVETNSLHLGARLESYFAAYLSPPTARPDVTLRALDRTPAYDAARMRPWPSAKPAHGRLAKESTYDDDGTRYILKNRTGILIVIGDNRSQVTGDIDAHANQVINLICTLFGMALLDQEYVMVHASAVVDHRDQRALVFLGNSGSGKSSVALQLIERGGFDFLSNDRVLLRVDGNEVRVAGLPKQPRVNPGTLLASKALVRLLPRARRRLYAELRPAELWGIEEKSDVDIERDLGARSRLTAPLGRIFALQWRPDVLGLDLGEMSADAGVSAMMATAKDFGPFDRLDRPDPAAEFGRIAHLAPPIAVTGRRDPAALARALAEAQS